MDEAIQDGINTELFKKFRIYKLTDGFEVWVGKDSRSNDLLTMKYSKQNDLWFHVSGTSGSHTVLKIPENYSKVPQDMLKTAARIAAYYSKARNARNVKVSYTKIKNVQKYRGARPGSVLIKNEKTINVEPVLPIPG
jgi:predicted ribosome quality control (RQC) complex YloA/Tae2 family protein